MQQISGSKRDRKRQSLTSQIGRRDQKVLTTGCPKKTFPFGKFQSNNHCFVLSDVKGNLLLKGSLGSISIYAIFLLIKGLPKYGFENRVLEKSLKRWKSSDGDMFHSFHVLHHTCEGM